MQAGCFRRRKWARSRRRVRNRRQARSRMSERQLRSSHRKSWSIRRSIAASPSDGRTDRTSSSSAGSTIRTDHSRPARNRKKEQRRKLVRSMAPRRHRQAPVHSNLALERSS